ncbi:hypothetical protein A4F85_01245 [Delftia sp. GW456-R20]|nr:hypothetical protein A4F85_01245 [Delftia sp. GW456-R20]
MIFLWLSRRLDFVFSFFCNLANILFSARGTYQVHRRFCFGRIALLDLPDNPNYFLVCSQILTDQLRRFGTQIQDSHHFRKPCLGFVILSKQRFRVTI